MTAAAEAAGVKPGMRLGEALATCPSLVLVDRDPARSSGSGRAPAPARGRGLRRRPGRAGRRRLRDAGGRAALRRRAAGARARARRGRVGVGPARRRRRAPLHRPRRGERRAARPDPARRGEGGGVVPRAAPALAAPAASRPLRRARGARAAPARRAGAAPRARSRRGWGWRGGRRGGSPAAAAGRRCAGASRRSSSPRRSRSPEAVANELTLRRALGSSSSACSPAPSGPGGRFRKLALAARLVDGGSWRRAVDAPRRDRRVGPPALGARAEAPRAPAPIVELRLEAVELAEHTGQQLALVEPAGEEAVVRLREGLRQVRASTGTGSVCAVVEVAPWSRIPEARALVVPRDV